MGAKKRRIGFPAYRTKEGMIERIKNAATSHSQLAIEPQLYRGVKLINHRKTIEGSS